MEYRIVFSGRASRQLVDLDRAIEGRGSPIAAERYVRSIVDYCRSFSLFPHRGTRRDDIRPGFRTIGFRRSATIAFVISEDTVRILGIFYGGQSYEALLQDNSEFD